ncbi:MAG: transcription termination factor Rho [Planctomycetota bacterium]|jgi:transcription termination factor Rho
MTSLPQLLEQTREQLLATATERGIDLRPHLVHDELVHAIATNMMENGETVTADGVLDVLPEGFGFIRMVALDFQSTSVDAYVSANQVRSLNLHSGHRIRGELRAPRSTERTFALVHVDLVQDTPPEQLMGVTGFASRTAIAASRPLTFTEDQPDANDDTQLMLHAMQTLAPMSFGSRILMHAPAKWQRARWLALIACSLREQHPDADVTVCMLDQRPEDIVTARDMIASGATLISTAFASPPERHVAVAELAWHRCLRQVEQGHDVILLVDSLTALTRARSRSSVPSGSWIQPGLDAKAILLAKEVLASTMECKEGGSLTVIATVTTGEPGTIDEAIEREFAALTNSDIVIDATTTTCSGLCFDVNATQTRDDGDLSRAVLTVKLRQLRSDLAVLPHQERAAHWVAAMRDFQ